MKTRDALILSLIDSGLAKGQRHAAEVEKTLQDCIEIGNISQFSASGFRIRATGDSYIAIGKLLHEMADRIETERTRHENERYLSLEVPEGR